MSYAKLSIDLIANLAEFSGDMGKAAYLTEKHAARMSAAFGAVKATLGGLAGSLALGGLTEIARASIDSVDALNDVADATGASIAKISALDDLSARTGGNLDTVSTSLLKLNKVLTEALPGSEQEAILKSIGLSAQELRAVDPADALLQVAKALDQYEDGGKKARLMQLLLNKSTKDMSTLLKDLAEKSELVGTLTKEQTDEAERFNKQLFVMQASVKAVTRSLAIDLVTGINATVKAFQDGEAAGKSYLAIANDRYWANVRSAYGIVAESADSYRGRLAEIDKQLSGGESRLLVRNALLREQTELQAKLAATPVGPASNQTGAESARLGRKRVLPDQPDTPPKPPRQAAKTTGPDPDADFKRYLENLQKQLEKTQDLTVYQQLLADLDKQRLTTSPAQLQELTMLAQKLDLTRQIAEEEQGYADQAKLDRNTRIQAESARAAQVRGLLDATPTANLEDQRKDMQLLTEEYERFVATNGEAGISEQLYLEAVSARLNLTKEKVEESKTAAESMQYVFTNAFKDMEASLVDFVQTGKLDFSSLAESIIADMARIAIQQSVTKPLTASLTSLFGFADGGVVNSPSLSAFSGGVYNSPQLFKFASGAGVFGEAGPEAIMPLKRGANGQLGVQASGGGGSVVVNIIEAPGKGGSQGRRSENGVDMLDIFVEKVRSAIAGDISRGTGAVPNAMSQTYGLNRVAGAY